MPAPGRNAREEGETAMVGRSDAAELVQLTMLADPETTFEYIRWFWVHVMSGTPIVLPCRGTDASAGPEGSILFWEFRDGAIGRPFDQSSAVGSPLLGLITRSTKFGFAYRRYRVTFSLDISPSVASVDSTASAVVAQRLFASLETCIVSLIRPIVFRSASGTVILEHTPDIFLSIIAQGSLPSAYRVLLQGVHLSKGNCSAVLRALRKHTDNLESTYKAFYARSRLDGYSGLVGFGGDDDDQNESGATIAHTDLPVMFETKNAAVVLAAAAELALDVAVHQHAFGTGGTSTQQTTSLVQHLTDGVFAVRQLPRARSCLVLFTDAVVQLPQSCSTYGGLISQINRDKIPCCVVQVLGGRPPDVVESSFGFVANTEAMEYLASATGGSLITVDDLTKDQSCILEKLLVDPYKFGHASELTETARLHVRSYVLKGLSTVDILRLRYSEGFQWYSLPNEALGHATFRHCWQPDMFVIYELAPSALGGVDISLSVEAPKVVIRELSKFLRGNSRGKRSSSIGILHYLLAIGRADEQVSKFHEKLHSLLQIDPHSNPQIRDRAARFWELLQEGTEAARIQGIELNESIDVLLVTDDVRRKWLNTAKSDQGVSEPVLSSEAALQRLQGGAYSHRLSPFVQKDAEEATFSAFCALRRLLERWASFSDSENHIRVLLDDNDSPCGFLAVHEERKAERLITLRLGFYAAPNVVIRRALEEFRSRLQTATVTAKNSRAKRSVVSVFAKSIRRLVVNYDRNVDSQNRAGRFHSLLRPTFPLLRAYLRRQRWSWHVRADLRSAALSLLSHSRTHREGFSCTNTSPYLAFVKQIGVKSVGSAESDIPVPCVLQYICYTMPAADPEYCKLIYDFWMEPQWGDFAVDTNQGTMEVVSTEQNDGSQLFAKFADWMSSANLGMINALSSFHTLVAHATSGSNKISLEGFAPTTSVGSFRTRTGLQIPPFSFESVLACARAVHTASFNDLVSETDSTIGNSASLHVSLQSMYEGLLIRTLELLVDFVLVPTERGSFTSQGTLLEHLGLDQKRCFGKLVVGENAPCAIVLVFVKKRAAGTSVSPLEVVFVECFNPAWCPPRQANEPPVGLRAPGSKPRTAFRGVHQRNIDECTFATQLLVQSLRVESKRVLGLCLYTHLRQTWRSTIAESCPLFDRSPAISHHCLAEVPRPLSERALRGYRESVLSVDVSEYIQIVQRRHSKRLGLRDTTFHAKLLALISNGFVPLNGFHHNADSGAPSTHSASISTDWSPDMLFVYSPRPRPLDGKSGEVEVTDVFGVDIQPDDTEAQLLYGEPSEAGTLSALSDYELPAVSRPTRPQSRSTYMWQRASLYPPEVPSGRVSSPESLASNLLQVLRGFPSPIDAKLQGVFTSPFFLRVAYDDDIRTLHANVQFVVLTPSFDGVVSPVRDVRHRRGALETLPSEVRPTMRILEANVVSLLSEEILHTLREDCVWSTQRDDSDGRLAADTSATEGLTDASMGIPLFQSTVLSEPSEFRNPAVRIDKRTLDSVMHHLSKVHKSSVSAFTIPLTFMPGTDAARFFSEELLRTHSLRGSGLDFKQMSLRRFEGGYFVMDFWRSAGVADEAVSDAESTSFELDKNDETADPIVRLSSQTDSNLPFWLILQLIESNESLRVWFHSSTMSRVDKSGIFATLRSSVRSVGDRANQVALLQQMHERREVSELVCPPDIEDRTTIREVKIRHHVFRTGQFACPLVHRMVIPLHPRLQVEEALSVLRSSALDPFGISGRKNFFVIRERAGTVFYMRVFGSEDAFSLSEDISIEPSRILSARSQASESGASQTTTPYVTEQSESDAADVRRTGKDQNIVTSSEKSAAVVIEVFGVTVPGPEITSQLRELISSKLSAQTLSNLRELLERNPLFKLTSADIEFIRGPLEFPTKTLTFCLPSFIQPGFFLILRQTFAKAIGSKLHRETTSSSTDALPEHWREFADDFYVCTRATDSVALLLMIHNPPCVKQDDDVWEALEWLSELREVDALDADDEANGTGEPFRDAPLGQDDPQVHSSEEDEVGLSGGVVRNFPNMHELEVSLWGRHGFINFEALSKTLTRCVNHAICDYAMERWLVDENARKISGSSEPLWLDSVSSIIGRALKQKAPAFRVLRHSLGNFPAWAIYNLIQELQQCIARVNKDLPSVLILTTPLSAPASASRDRPKDAQSATNLYASLTHSAPLVDAVLGLEDMYALTTGKEGNVQRTQVPWRELLTRRTEYSFNVVAGPTPFSSSTLPDSAIDDDLLHYSARFGDAASGHRALFAHLTLESDAVHIKLYNWSLVACEQLIRYIAEASKWFEVRKIMLESIFLQKLGFFDLQVTHITIPSSLSRFLDAEGVQEATTPVRQNRLGPNSRQQQVLALMSNQKVVPGRSLRETSTQSNVDVFFTVDNIKALIISNNPFAGYSVRDMAIHQQLLLTRRRWLPRFPFVLQRSFSQRSRAAGLLAQVGMPDSRDPVCGHGEQFLDAAFTQARAAREVEREGQILFNWLRACQSPRKRGMPQHPEHLRYILRASECQWELCVPWLFEAQVGWTSSMQLDVLESFVDHCDKTMGLHRIFLEGSAAGQPIQFVQRYHNGGLIVISICLSTVVRMQRELVFFKVRLYALENSRIPGVYSDEAKLQIPSSDEVVLSLASSFRTGSLRQQLLQTVRARTGTALSQRARATTIPTPKLQQEHILAADSARFKLSLRPREFMFNFHVRQAFTQLCGKDRGVSFRALLRFVSSLSEVFADCCGSPKNFGSRDSAASILEVGLMVPLNPTNVALPLEVFQFLSQNAGTYRLLRVSGADAMVVPDETVSHILSTRVRRSSAGNSTDSDDCRRCALILPKHTGRQDQLQLQLYLMRSADSISATVSTSMTEDLLALSDWLEVVVHAALLHFQRDLLFAKLLAAKSSSIDKPTPPTQSKTPTQAVVKIAPPSEELTDPLVTLSSYWSPQIVRTGAAHAPAESRIAKNATSRRPQQLSNRLEGLSEQEFDTLISLCVSRSGDQCDPRLSSLFGVRQHLNWRNVLVDIFRAYGLDNVRELGWRRGEHHFVILNTLPDKNFFLHLEFREETNKVMAHSCSLHRPAELDAKSQTRMELDASLRQQLQALVDQTLSTIYKNIV